MLLLIRIFSCLPLPILYFMADCLIYPLARYIIAYRLKIVRKNIRNAFPEKSHAEQQKLVNAFYHHLADTIVEIIYGYRASKEEMQQRVVFDNIEVIEDLARRKQGVIAYLGHMGNWEWMADLANQFQDRSIVEYNVYRRQKNTSADQAMLRLRSKRGGECIEKNLLLRKLVQLRQATHPFIIGLIADQKPSPRNAHVWTNFLNQDTSFLDGGEVLARKFDLGVVYLHITCTQRGYYRVHFDLITDNANNLPPNAITLAYVELLERNIQQQPHRWLWSHNRWKWSRQDK